jgi:hypothetical protein
MAFKTDMTKADKALMKEVLAARKARKTAEEAPAQPKPTMSSERRRSDRSDAEAAE